MGGGPRSRRVRCGGQTALSRRGQNAPAVASVGHGESPVLHHRHNGARPRQHVGGLLRCAGRGATAGDAWPRQPVQPRLVHLAKHIGEYLVADRAGSGKPVQALRGRRAGDGRGTRNGRHEEVLPWPQRSDGYDKRATLTSSAGTSSGLRPAKSSRRTHHGPKTRLLARSKQWHESVRREAMLPTGNRLAREARCRCARNSPGRCAWEFPV
mmetsp:Transcript_11098/g.42828  ORF Transcript_11098/g.42828 Transcript_11098/m.42828 type:complete len:211 (-) Transcript_11098:141-773(-)